ncbi:MAG: helix-turn-helix transcriptional regulator [Acidimicrobiales bacterium]
MPVRAEMGLFGTELKRWRQHRRYSQLDLANRAEVSQRHLSFLETGRSRPSPEMIEHLSVALDVPLRARNALFELAGFASAYSEEPLDGDALAQVRQGLETLVLAHDPFPAYVIDRSWNLLIANTSAVLLTGLLLPQDSGMELAGNVLRLFMHPGGARSSVANWVEAATVLLERLSAECAANPTDDQLAELFDEIVGYEGVDALAEAANSSVSHEYPRADRVGRSAVVHGDFLVGRSWRCHPRRAASRNAAASRPTYCRRTPALMRRELVSCQLSPVSISAITQRQSQGHRSLHYP